MKKIVLLAFVLVLLSTAVVVGFISPVVAEETIYIRSDGAVDPPTAPIQRDGNVYTFTDNINDSIVIQKDNIVIDGAGYTLQGTGANFSKGIDLSNRNNVTIKAMQIGSFQFGLYLISSSGNSIYGNTITNNSNIYLHLSSDNNITGNYVTNNDYGIGLSYSSNNNIHRNNITNNERNGISLDWSSNNIISENNITNNEIGIWLFVSSNNIIYHNNFVNNTKQVYDFNWDYPYTFPSVNIWDDGYPSGGNYWGDYEAKYPNATELDGSGIWDTPYVIDEGNQDNYPIVPEFQSLLILPLLMIATLLAAIVCRRRDLRQGQPQNFNLIFTLL